MSLLKRNFEHTLILWILIFAFLLFSNLLRTFFLLSHGADFTTQSSEIMECFSLGARFDLKAIAYLFLLPYLLSFFYLNKKAFSILTAFCILSGSAMLLANVYFYKAFGDNFNQQMFGFQGEALPVLSAMWQDYPLIKITLFSFSAAYASYKLSQKISVRRGNSFLYITTLILSLGLFFIALRGGSVGTFPLMRSQANFSSDQAINSASFNGILAFFDTIKFKFKPFPKIKFEDALQSYNQYYDKTESKQSFNLNKLFSKTQTNPVLAAHKPNVVFIQMESMGRHFLLYDDPKTNDLLGSLRPFIRHDFLFTHIISDYNGTAPVLARFTFNSPTEDIFNTAFSASYATTVTQPFKDAGYETVFLTPGELGWYNTGEVFRKHGFDRTLGRFDILRQFPNAESCVHGIYEQYAYDYALLLLQQAERDNKPILIYINTMTNHPPYTIPQSYKVKPIQVNAVLAQRLQVTNDKMKTIFAAYQYANDSLGNFVTAIEHSTSKDKTIIAAVGDHNLHELMPTYTNKSELGLQYGVFFYMHVPKLYLTNTAIDRNIIGSQKDIFPTLYHLALSNVTYPNFGDDLSHAHHFTFGNNVAMISLPEGIIALTGTPLFYPWNKDHITVGKAQKLTPELKQQLARVHAFNKLLYWQVSSQLLSS